LSARQRAGLTTATCRAPCVYVIDRAATWHIDASSLNEHPLTLLNNNKVKNASLSQDNDQEQHEKLETMVEPVANDIEDLNYIY